MKKTNRVIASLMALTLLLGMLLSLAACGDNTIDLVSFSGNYNKDGDVTISGKTYKKINEFPYEYARSILNRGWIGEEGKKKPKDAKDNAELINEVILLVDGDNAAYCREDHYDKLLTEMNANNIQGEVYFTFLMDFSSSYRYYLSAEQEKALNDVFNTVAPVAASTVFIESNGKYRFEGGIPLMIKSESPYFNRLYKETIVYVSEKYYLIKEHVDTSYPRLVEADHLVYPVPENYFTLMGAIFECKGGKLTQDDDEATKDLAEFTTTTTTTTTAKSETSTTN